jgi:hypothetical protein
VPAGWYEPLASTPGNQQAGIVLSWLPAYQLLRRVPEALSKIRIKGIRHIALKWEVGPLVRSIIGSGFLAVFQIAIAHLSDFPIRSCPAITSRAVD